MELIYVIFLALLLAVAWGTRKSPAGTGKIFGKSAAFLFRLIFPEPGGPSRLRYEAGKWHGQKETTVNHLKALYPGQDLEKKVKAHGIEKVRLALLLIFLGNILALAVNLAQKPEPRVSETGLIRKNTWETGEFSLDLKALADRAEELTVTVRPTSLTEAEAERLAAEVFAQLPAAILGRNTGLDHITDSLKLVTQWQNYPFQISWESSRPQIVNPTGEVTNENLSPAGKSANESPSLVSKSATENLPLTGEPVILTACLRYQDSVNEYLYRQEIALTVYPPDKTAEEEWRDSLCQAIENAQEKHAGSDMLQLPPAVAGIAVRWQEKIKNDSLILWLLFLLAAGAVYLGQDKELHKKVAGRNRQTDRDYPELVRKLALYLGAGMTVKNAWKKMTEDYLLRENREDSRILYEEMLISLRELENGRPESEVYFRFGKRLGGNRYRKLAGLLCGHLQKGNQNLLRVLREEADLALEERKNLVRVLGEEMGTRLLFPMILMLLIVMVFIMVPAYSIF